MAANTRIKPIGYGSNDLVTATEMQALQVQSAASINRSSSLGGYRTLPLILCGGSSIEMGITDNGDMYTTGNTGFVHYFPLLGLPHGHVLDAVRLWIKPADAVRGGNPPGNLPFMELFTIPTGSGMVSDSLGTATAIFYDEAYYEGGQPLLISGLGHTVNLEACSYRLVFMGEYGSNSFAGLQLGCLECSVTLDTSEGGPDFTHWK